MENKTNHWHISQNILFCVPQQKECQFWNDTRMSKLFLGEQLLLQQHVLKLHEVHEFLENQMIMFTNMIQNDPDFFFFYNLLM